MNKLDHLIKSIDRLVELNEEMLQEIRGCGSGELRAAQKQTKPKIDIEVLGQLMNSNQVREELTMSRSTLYRNIKAGIFSPIRIGKQNWFNCSEVDALRRYFMK